MLEIYNEKT
jgi:kinesin family protein 13